MIFIDPIVAMLHNQKTDQWHPILFVGSLEWDGEDVPAMVHFFP